MSPKRQHHPLPADAGVHHLLVTLSWLHAGAAVVLLVAALTRDFVLLWWLAGLAAVGGYLWYALSGAGRNPRRRVRVNEATLTIAMRRDFPIAAGLGVIFLSAFFAWCFVVSEGLARYAAAMCCLMLAIGVPDVLRGAPRRQRVVLSPDHIVVRSWGVDASIDWDDVDAVSMDSSIPTRPAIRIEARPPAPSLSVHRRRWLVPVEPRPPAGQIMIPALPLDEPWLLLAVLQNLSQVVREERVRRLTHGTYELLTRQIPSQL